jgi:outer membrane scaffolding protein for murein synthesis (MipA/OmpV family)
MVKKLLIIVLLGICTNVYAQKYKKTEWNFGIGANATFFPIFYDHNKDNVNIFMIRKNTIGVAPNIFLQRNCVRLTAQYDILPKSVSLGFQVTLWRRKT